MHVCHKCDTPLCINPDHLFLGTHSDNMRDKETKGRANHAIGNRHPRTKLTPEQVMEIRNSPCRGWKFRKKYGISGWNVAAIKAGRIWKHLREGGA